MKKWFFSLFLFVSTHLVAQPVINMEDPQVEQILFLHQLTYYIDSSNTVGFNDILKPEYAQRFKQHGTYKNKDFQPNSTYWLRIPVQHNAHNNKVWLFEFYDQTIDHIEAFVPGKDGTYDHQIMGDQYPFLQRNFLHKNFEIQVNINTDTLAVYYFKVRSHEFADIRIAYRSINRFVFYAMTEYFLYGTFYGMILIIVLYNFLMFMAIRERKNIYYILYILSVAFYAMSLDGIGFQYLWPQHPEWNNYAIGVTLYSVILWALIFTRRFLTTTITSPLLDRYLKGMILLRTTWFVFEFYFFPEYFTYRVIEIIPLSLIFYTSIRVWYKGYRPARFFVIAYGVLLIGFLFRTLVYVNIFPLTTISHYSLHISFVLEMLFLTFALGDRIRILKDNRDRALRRIIHQHEENMQLKDQVNRELEQKVQERTVALNGKNLELESSNQKLIRQAHEINQINSILDLDNWKLKNRVKEVLQNHLLDKMMGYDQFKTLYPDTFACYRFLENLKWKKGFQCRKCGNKKYFDGTQKFARRCTRCGYNESITAFTIFHSIKFPIERAFYIAYLVVAEKKDYTLENLAHQLELRVNTVWGFRQKVADQILHLEKKGRKPLISKWEDVVMMSDSQGIMKNKAIKKPA